MTDQKQRVSADIPPRGNIVRENRLVDFFLANMSDMLSRMAYPRKEDFDRMVEERKAARERIARRTREEPQGRQASEG